MKSISKRLNLIFVSIVTVVLIASGALNYFSAKSDLDQRLQEQSTALSTRLKLSVPALLWNFDEKQIDKTLEAEMVEADILGILVRTKDSVASGRLRTADGKIQPAAKDAKLPEPFQRFALEFIDNGTSKTVGQIEFSVSTERRDAALQSLIVKLAMQIIVLNILLVVTLSISLRTLVFRPLGSISHALQQIASGEADLTKRLDVGERNEIGEVAHWFNTFVGRLQEIVSHIIESTNGLAQAEKTMSQGIEQSAQRANEQSEIITSMAAAMEEMTVGISHVSDQSTEVHTVSEQSGTLARGGGAAVNELIAEMRRIADSVNRSSETIEALGKESEKISSVVKVIKDIADQTNLLALNAAIEAARAGEQGRGFAVVADEVRLLAQRTQKSTAEIQAMIERLQSHSEAAVKVIGDSSRASQLTIEQAGLAGASLNAIGQALRNLNGLNASIASATLQQAHVVEDINQNVTQAAGLSHSTELAAEQSSVASVHLKELSEQLNGLLKQFRV